MGRGRAKLAEIRIDRVSGPYGVAFFATDVFLRLNGWYLEVDAADAHETLIGLLETGRADFDHLLPWIRAHVHRF